MSDNLLDELHNEMKTLLDGKDSKFRSISVTLILYNNSTNKLMVAGNSCLQCALSDLKNYVKEKNVQHTDTFVKEREVIH